MAAWFTWGCDPMRRINMKNRTDEKAEIIWHIMEDSILSSPLYISNSQKVKFELLPGGRSRDIKMSFGMGNWSPRYLKSVIDDLDSVEIRWNNKYAVLRSHEEMYEYLSARRRTPDKSKIQIVFKKD